MGNCVVCGKKLISKQTKFCSSYCKHKENNRKHGKIYKIKYRGRYKGRYKDYDRKRNRIRIHDPKYRKKFKKWQKVWKIKNKEKLHNYRRKYRNNNREKVIEHKFINRHRTELDEILGRRCSICYNDKIRIEFHHLAYKNLPKNSLIDYSKYLVPVCFQCHNIIHKRIGFYHQIIPKIWIHYLGVHRTERFKYLL